MNQKQRDMYNAGRTAWAEGRGRYTWPADTPQHLVCWFWTGWHDADRGLA